jgi:hypothetical protein
MSTVKLEGITRQFQIVFEAQPRFGQSAVEIFSR